MPDCDLTILKNREELNKARYCDLQQALDNAVNDDAALRILAAKVDIQLKLEDFLIKSREADHAKLYVFGPIFASSAVIAAIVSLIIGWLKQ